MNLPLKIARRYLFAKKSTSAINIITGIAVFGVAVGTAALVLVLSVFNGFEDLITAMYSNFNPDVRITPAKGKTFEVDSTIMLQLRTLEGVEYVSETLEEVAFFEYKDNQDFGTLKGVDKYFALVTNIDSTVREGSFQLRDGVREMAVLGFGMRNKLGVNVDDLFSSISVYMPKRRKVTIGNQFRKKFVYPGGTFSIQQDFDNQYVLTTLDFARELLNLDNEVSSLELKLLPGFYIPGTFKKIKAIMGEDFLVKNRFEQEEAFLKLMQMEKWLSFAIVGLMMVMVAFNIIGALWMIVLEKKKDIAILRSMGAREITIRNIFLNEGMLLCALGIMSGFILGLIIYIIQKEIGIVTVPGEYITSAYPISIRYMDFVVVAITVFMIGLLASIPPALRAMRVSAMIREE